MTIQDYNLEYLLTAEDLHYGFVVILGCKFPLQGYTLGDRVRIRMTPSPQNDYRRVVEPSLPTQSVRDVFGGSPVPTSHFGIDHASPNRDSSVHRTVTGRLRTNRPEEQRLPPKPAAQEPDYLEGVGSKLVEGLLSNNTSITKRE